MYCTTCYSEPSKAFVVSFFSESDRPGLVSRNNRKAEYFDSEQEANNRVAELIATEEMRYILPLPLVRIRMAVYDMLREYENRTTYTDCEEYRKEGAVGVLEDLIEKISLIEKTERERNCHGI